MAVYFALPYFPLVLLTLALRPFIAVCKDLPLPVALYPLNELYYSRDASCYGNLAGKVQGTNLVKGPSGTAKTAYEFSGFKESYVRIPQSQHLDVKNSITILAWVYQVGKSGSVILYWNEGPGIELRTSDKNTVSVQFMKRSGESVPSLSNSTFNLHGSWQYIGASYNHNTGTATLWLDGKRVQQRNLGKLELKTNGDVVIGGGQGDSDSFEGKVSCLQIYDKVLSEKEIVAVQNRCFEDSLVPVDCQGTDAPSGCGVPLHTLSGEFYSPGFPAGYPNLANCVWEIEVPKEYTITLKFSRLDLEQSSGKWPNCDDYIIIRDGTSSWSDELKALCGSYDDNWEEEISSSGNGMRIEFITDRKETDVGFAATYTTAPVTKVTEEEDLLDFSRHYTGIVIGVACAAIFTILSIITFNHTRRRLLGRQHRSSSRRTVSFHDDIFQQNAPPTYDDVMRCPELYPPTPCPGSVINTPVMTPRWGSPTSSPALSRHSATPQRPRITMPKTGTPIGLPFVFTRPRAGGSNCSTPVGTPRGSLQRGISPLARAGLTPQHSRHADHESSDDEDEAPPPYPGIIEDTSVRTYTPRNVYSVLDQVREALELDESQRYDEAQSLNAAENNGNVSDSDSRITAGQAVADSHSSSAVAENREPNDENNTKNVVSYPVSGHDSRTGSNVNPWVLPEESSRENTMPTTLNSIESIV